MSAGWGRIPKARKPHFIEDGRYALCGYRVHSDYPEVAVESRPGSSEDCVVCTRRLAQRTTAHVITRSQGAANVEQGPNRKPCAWPGCNYTVPLHWRFCSDRRCQSSRMLAKWLGPTPEQHEVLKARDDHLRAQAKRYQKNALAYAKYWKRRWRREQAKAYRSILVSNAHLRAEQRRLAYEGSDEEIRELIEEQERDGHRVYSWAAISLDAPLFDDDLTLADILDGGPQSQRRIPRTQVEFWDPTFDLARPELERWLTARRLYASR